MCKPWFTIPLLLASLLAGPAVARADRAVLLPPHGEDVPVELEERVEAGLVTAIRTAGHTPITERMAWEAPDAPPPETANELRAVAEVQGSQWAVVPRVRETDGDGYELTLRVGYAPQTRVEEITVEVRAAREQARLDEVMAALLRPEGLGDERERLEGEDRIAREQEAEARRRAEAEARAREQEAAQAAREREAREAFEERERERAEQERERAEAEEQRAWEARERYGETAPWMLQLGLAARPIVSHDPGGRGGTLGAVALRAGRSFAGVPGVEARVGAEAIFGAAGGLALYAGVAYLEAFFPDVPVFLGASLELGYFQTLTGNRRASFMLRGAPTAAWRFTGDWFLEATALEVMWLSAGEGAITLGFSARIGRRF